MNGLLINFLLIPARGFIKANLRHITQVAIELEKQDGDLFLKAIKVEGRFSRSAFLPKRYEVWEEEVIFPALGGRRPGNLGEKIRRLRNKLGMTQKKLATQMGVTPSFISQLEKNLISPSLDSLLKLIERLHTQPIYFLTNGDATTIGKLIIKPRERQQINLPEIRKAGIKLESLISESVNRRMEIFLLTLRKGIVIDGHFYKHKGDEFFYLLKGEIEVEIQNEKMLLREGDGLYISSDFPSRWANLSKGDAVILWVISPPRSSF